MKRLVIFALLLIAACGSVPVITQHPTETQTVASEPVQQVQVIADAPKTDVPVSVDVKKDQVFIVEHPQASGKVEKTYIVVKKKGLFKKPVIEAYNNETAATATPAPVTVHTIEPSRAWLYWLIGIALGLLVLVAALWALGKYVPFFGPLIKGLNAAADPIAGKVGEVAGEVGASAIEAERGIVKRLIAWIKAKLKR